MKKLLPSTCPERAVEFTIDDVKSILQKHNSVFLASQKEVSFPILQRITTRLKLGYDLGNIQIDNGLIVNGHHRYISHLLLDQVPGTISWTRSPGRSYQWKEVLVVNVDYDSEEEKEQFEKDFPIYQSQPSTNQNLID